MNKRIVKKEIKKWLKENNVGDLNVKFSNDFEYRESNGDSVDTICIGTESGDLSEFIKCARKLGFKLDYQLKTLQLLHEIGHYKTVGDFNEKELQEDEATRLVLYDKIENGTDSEATAALILYYQLPQEIEATRWAINFMNNNPEATRKLQIALN